MSITLSTLTYFPIKSCRGFDVDSAMVKHAGLERDRSMMVVNLAGDLLTQREHAKLAWVIPTLVNGTVTLSARDHDSIQVPIQTSGPTVPVRVWKNKGIQAVDQGEEAAQWLSDWLGASVRLVHIADGYKRLLDPAYATTSDDHTGFADGYPILLASEESLDDLNSRLDKPISMNRFRPNLVVRGCEPFAEDTWKRIRIGAMDMAVVKPCGRCVVTTIDKETLEADKEPLKTLATFRKQGSAVMFGQNVIPLNEGRLEVGMSVEVLS
jgi:uncharacterized protein